MSETIRPKDTRMTICDLCDKELTKTEPGETASLTHGFIAHKAETPRTKWVYLLWPPAGREHRKSWEQMQRPENKPRRYDFHADCILQLVEDAIEARRLPTRKATT